ncbi:MAG TPA: hypothetical protein VEV62_08095 [Parafilimonas sp.]|nr:hypothetical protein [Parafilimonas sp.]
MKYTSCLKKKNPNNRRVSILIAAAVIIATGYIFKKLADSQSKVEY